MIKYFKYFTIPLLLEKSIYLDCLIYFVFYHKRNTAQLNCHPIANLSQLINKPAIKIRQIITPTIGNTGTKGTLKPLSASGLVFRITITPMQTRENANNVPILTM
jgi:hypothetical protein